MLIVADTISRHDHGELVFSHIRQAFPDYVPEVPEEANYYRNRVTSGCMRPRSLGIMSRICGVWCLCPRGVLEHGKQPLCRRTGTLGAGDGRGEGSFTAAVLVSMTSLIAFTPQSGVEMGVPSTVYIHPNPTQSKTTNPLLGRPSTPPRRLSEEARKKISRGPGEFQLPINKMYTPGCIRMG
jgi:hypothetical protein